MLTSKKEYWDKVNNSKKSGIKSQPKGKTISLYVDYNYSKYMLKEWSLWFESDREGLGLGYTSSTAFKDASSERNEYPETENTKLMKGILTSNKLFHLAAQCTFVYRKKSSLVAKAKWMAMKGVDMGRGNSMMQSNYKQLEVQLFSFILGFLSATDDTLHTDE